MNTIIGEKVSELRRLCSQHRVRRLELFGSAARDDFDAGRSDLDFVVEFEDMPPADYGDAYFGLLAALEDLFGRPVDLVVLSAVRNPYMRDAIDESRILLYAA